MLNDPTEYVLRQELRTLQIMNNSKSREISRLEKWINDLKDENTELKKSIDIYQLKA